MINPSWGFDDPLDSGKIRIRVQNQETKILIAEYNIEIEDVEKHIKKLCPKIRVRKVGLSTLYLRMKMSKNQMQITKDYLEFMFN